MKKYLLYISLVFSLCAQSQQSITLLQPTAGSIWEGAKTYTITWESQNINLIKIEFNANDGNSWQPMEEAYPATAFSYEWTVPAQPTDSARIRLLDVDNPAIYSVSGLFTIPYPEINIESVSSLKTGQPYTLFWESTSIAEIGVLFSNNNASSWDTVFTNVNAQLKIKNWAVPEAADTCLIKLYDESNPEVFSISNLFTITEMPEVNMAKYNGGSYDGYARFSNLNPALEVTYPAGGESFERGTLQKLKWDATNIPQIMILFSLDGGGNWYDTIYQSYPASALSIDYTLPNIPTEAAQFKIISTSPEGFEAVSGTFTILEPFVSINNTFPELKSGTPYPIFWESQSVNFISVAYSPDDGINYTLLKEFIPAENKVYNLNVPEPTDQAKIKIWDSELTDVFDESEGFTISNLQEPNPAKYRGGSYDGYAKLSNTGTNLELLYPIGGESFESGDEIVISWNAENINQVMLLYSNDGGENWPDTITDFYPAGALNFPWTVPNAPTQESRIKVVSVDYPDLESESDNFIILDFYIGIQNSFELLFSGTPQPVFWESTSVNFVTIAYSDDAGQNYTTLKANIPACNQVYNLSVPEPTTQGIIKIWDSENPETFDETELFVISELPEANTAKYQGGSYDGYAKWWFKTADSNCPNDTTVFDGDPVFTLTGATPPGGTWSGPGVSNGIFDPAVAGIGNHQIFYEATYINGTVVCSFYIEVIAPSMNANDDTGIPVNGETGGIAVANVLENDSLDAMPVVPAEVSVAQISSVHPSVNLDSQSGEVYVDQGTPTGDYTLVYEVCEIAHPANCDQATVLVQVFELPVFTFCLNDQVAEPGVALAFCSNERIDFHACDIQNGLPPFAVCWEIDGEPDCDLSVIEGDTLISEFFTEGNHNIKLLSITDDLGNSVMDLSQYDYDFNIIMGSSSFAGNDNTICEGASLALNSAWADGYSGVQWSGGDGAFVPSIDVVNPVYVPGAQDIGSGMVELCITAFSIDPCTTASSDCLNLVIQPEPVANAGEDITVCETDMFAEIEGMAEHAAYVEWTSDSFTGFFDDAGSLVTNYFFSPEDISIGTVELCLTAIPQNPCLITDTDCLQLNIVSEPVADAGPDQTICEGEPIELSMASVENAGNTNWTTPGDGTFDDPSLVATMYYPGPEDNSMGSVQLCITANPQAGCTTSDYDCLNLDIIETPEADLDSVRRLSCTDYDVANGEWLPVSLNNSISEDYLSLEWTTDGDGTFDDPAAVSPEYFPGTADRWHGQVELEINI